MGQPGWAEPYNVWGNYTPKPQDQNTGPAMGGAELNIPEGHPLSRFWQQAMEALGEAGGSYFGPMMAPAGKNAFDAAVMGAGKVGPQAMMMRGRQNALSDQEKSALLNLGKRMPEPGEAVSTPRGGWSAKYDPKRVGPPGPNEMTSQEVAALAEPVKEVADDPDEQAARNVAGIGGSARSKADPAKEAAKPVADAFKEEAKGLKDIKTLIDKYDQKKRDVDFGPLAALTDAWTGSKFANSYQRPLNDEEHDRVVLGFKEKLALAEGQLEYKREMMKQLSEQEKARLSQRDQDRDLKEMLGLGKIARGAAGSDEKAQAKQEKTDGTALSKHFRENKKALMNIAQGRYGKKMETGQVDPADQSWQTQVGPVNAEIFDFGKHLEESGRSKKGRGYYDALQFYLVHPGGPDTMISGGGDGG